MPGAVLSAGCRGAELRKCGVLGAEVRSAPTLEQRTSRGVDRRGVLLEPLVQLEDIPLVDTPEFAPFGHNLSILSHDVDQSVAGQGFSLAFRNPIGGQRLSTVARMHSRLKPCPHQQPFRETGSSISTLTAGAS